MIRPLRRWHSRWLQYDPPLPGASPGCLLEKRVNGWTRWRYLVNIYLFFFWRTHTQFSIFHVWIYTLPIIIGSQIIWKLWSHISFKTMYVFNGLADLTSAVGVTIGFYILHRLSTQTKYHHKIHPLKTNMESKHPHTCKKKLFQIITFRVPLLVLPYSCIVAYYHTIFPIWLRQSFISNNFNLLHMLAMNKDRIRFPQIMV